MFTKNQYREGGLPQKRLGQFVDLGGGGGGGEERGGWGWWGGGGGGMGKKGGVVFLRGVGLTPNAHYGFSFFVQFNFK